MDTTDTFGQWLKRRRKALDLTQAELADAVGYSLSTIRKVEADDERPSKVLVERLADALRIPTGERPAFTRFARDMDVADVSLAPLPLPTVPASTAVPAHSNLPAPPTPLIGREAERAAIVGTLRDSDVRLLILFGPGGTGKTRLALQVCADLVDAFDDGVFLVNLAPLSEPRLVLPAIAATLDVREPDGQPLLDALRDYLREKRLLLLLDNFEHVIAAAPDVATLLAAAPRLKILVTSREVLRLRGEHDYPVPPLTVPPAVSPDGPITQYEAVQLFIQRAQEVRPDFAVTPSNAPAVAEICYRLDGLPLAIELAAARVRVLPPEAILARLGSRLSVLTGGPRDLPPRQQTLRNAIAWSYDLLTPEEKALFRRLAVLVGTFNLEVAEAVSGAEASSVDLLDQMQWLVDKSLLRHAEPANGEPRFIMLDTLREFALEQLTLSGDETATRRAHASAFLALAEAAAAEIRGPRQVGWYGRLEREHLNLRAALAWARASGDTETLARLAAALLPFWYPPWPPRRGRRVANRRPGRAAIAAARPPARASCTPRGC